MRRFERYAGFVLCICVACLAFCVFPVSGGGGVSDGKIAAGTIVPKPLANLRSNLLLLFGPEPDQAALRRMFALFHGEYVKGISNEPKDADDYAIRGWTYALRSRMIFVEEFRKLACYFADRLDMAYFDNNKDDVELKDAVLKCRGVLKPQEAAEQERLLRYIFGRSLEFRYLTDEEITGAGMVPDRGPDAFHKYDNVMHELLFSRLCQYGMPVSEEGRSAMGEESLVLDGKVYGSLEKHRKNAELVADLENPRKMTSGPAIYGTVLKIMDNKTRMHGYLKKGYGVNGADISGFLPDAKRLREVYPDREDVALAIEILCQLYIRRDSFGRGHIDLISRDELESMVSRIESVEGWDDSEFLLYARLKCAEYVGLAERTAIMERLAKVATSFYKPYFEEQLNEMKEGTGIEGANFLFYLNLRSSLAKLEAGMDFGHYNDMGSFMKNLREFGRRRTPEGVMNCLEMYDSLPDMTVLKVIYGDRGVMLRALDLWYKFIVKEYPAEEILAAASEPGEGEGMDQLLQLRNACAKALGNTAEMAASFHKLIELYPEYVNWNKNIQDEGNRMLGELADAFEIAGDWMERDDYVKEAACRCHVMNGTGRPLLLSGYAMFLYRTTGNTANMMLEAMPFLFGTAPDGDVVFSLWRIFSAEYVKGSGEKAEPGWNRPWKNVLPGGEAAPDCFRMLAMYFADMIDMDRLDGEKAEFADEIKNYRGRLSKEESAAAREKFILIAQRAIEYSDSLATEFLERKTCEKQQNDARRAEAKRAEARERRLRSIRDTARGLKLDFQRLLGII